MLAVARAARRRAGSPSCVDLRLGDLREPPVDERVPLVICPFRSLLHMETEDEKLARARVPRARCSSPAAASCSTSSPRAGGHRGDDGRWLEREPGIFERADWDEGSRTLTLSVRSGDAAASFALHWLGAPEWLTLLDQAGFEVEALYGWFDRRPFDGERGHDLRLPARNAA